MAKKLLIILTLIVSVWWVEIFYTNARSQLQNYLWVVLLTFVPLIGGINGLLIARKWGGWQSIFGKCIIFISLGLLGWSFGDFVWSYFNLVEQIEVPYPSVADLGFFSIVPLWFLGIVYLLKTLKAKFAFKSWDGRALLIILPLSAFVITYFLFLKDKTFFEGGDPIKSFFDIAFPLGDVIILSLALLAFASALKFLGGRMKKPIMILILGFFFQYITDFSFSYTSSTGEYFNGSWVDMLYLVAQFFVSYGLASFDIKEA